jgi:hypothetical protein
MGEHSRGVNTGEPDYLGEGTMAYPQVAGAPIGDASPANE